MKKRDQWWKIIPIGLFSFGGLAGLLAFIPEYSAAYLSVGIILALIATIGAVVQ